MGLTPASSRGAAFTPVSVVAVRSALDVHASPGLDIKYTSIVDNEWDFNALTAIPAGLGITFLFDGTSATITTTVAGVWAFTHDVSFPQDATYFGKITLPFTGNQLGLPSLAGTGLNLAGAQIVALPSGASSAAAIATVTGSVANPYNVTATLSIVRLA